MAASALARSSAPGSSVTRRPSSGTLAEVVDIILDKGLVLDVYARVSLVGIELLTVDVRVVIASVDTYLHFAEATNRLDLRGQAEERDMSLKDLFSGSGMKDAASSKTEGALEGVKAEAKDTYAETKEKIKSVFGVGDDDSGNSDDGN